MAWHGVARGMNRVAGYMDTGIYGLHSGKSACLLPFVASSPLTRPTPTLFTLLIYSMSPSAAITPKRGPDPALVITHDLWYPIRICSLP